MKNKAFLIDLAKMSELRQLASRIANRIISRRNKIKPREPTSAFKASRVRSGVLHSKLVNVSAGYALTRSEMVEELMYLEAKLKTMDSQDNLHRYKWESLRLDNFQAVYSLRFSKNSKGRFKRLVGGGG